MLIFTKDCDDNSNEAREELETKFGRSTSMFTTACKSPEISTSRINLEAKELNQTNSIYQDLQGTQTFILK